MNLFTRYLLLICICCWGGGYALVAQTNPDAAEPKQTPLDLIFREIDPEDFNGSAFRIDGTMLRDAPVTHLSNMLGGVVPGFFSRQNTGGMVNESASYWIRSTRTNGEGVLVLVDGQERAFGVLSPHEVESIIVLKDASVAALYGMRASNGIIMINTRKGEMGGPKVEFTAQLINQRPIGVLDPVDAADYARHYNAAMFNDRTPLEYSTYDIWNYEQNRGVRSETYPNVDWLDKYFKKSSWVQRYNINVSGGIPKTRYFVNATYTRQGGMFNTDNERDYTTNNRAERYNIRSNVTMDVTPSTRLDLDLYGWYDTSIDPGTSTADVFQAMVTTPANAFPEWFEDTGAYVDDQDNAVTGYLGKIPARGVRNSSNPWAMLNRAGYTKLNKVYGSFRMRATQDLSVITKGLKLSAILSMDAATTSSIVRTKNFATYRPDPAISDVLLKTGNDVTMVNEVGDKNANRKTDFEGQISYDRLWGCHHVTGIAFYEQYEDNNDTSIPTRYQGVGGWFGYNYAKCYGIDFTMSYQGNYKFAPGKKYGFFPAVAAGWTLSNEPFFSGVKRLVPYMKFRASYGKLGNPRNVDEFYYRSSLVATTNIYTTGNGMGTNLNGYIEDVIANSGLTWEEATQFNIGVDARLFEDRITVTADYFTDYRTKMYVTNSRVSSLMGLPISISENIGAMHAKGFELMALWQDRIGKVYYSVGGTYSYSRNKQTALGEISQPYPWMESTGYSRSIKKGYVAEGFFNSWEEIAAAPKHTFSQVAPGDIRYRDINGDGLIDTYDQIPLGYNDVPDIFYGVHMSVSYRGFSVYALFQGAARLTRNIGGQVSYPLNGSGNIFEHQLNYWTPETAATADMPRISNNHSGSLNNSQNSTIWFVRGDYVRLKNVEIAYDFTETMLKRGFVKGLRIFAGGYNLMTWTKCKWVDPEDNPSFTSLPLTRNYSLGCSIKF